jgi:hypothetical protein
MTMAKVTDPAVLARLEALRNPSPGAVTDPALRQRLQQTMQHQESSGQVDPEKDPVLQAAEQAWENTPWWEQAVIGFEEPFRRMTETDEDQLRRLDAASGLPYWGGRVLSELGSVVAPGGLLAKGATKVPGAARAATAAAQAARRVPLAGRPAVAATTSAGRYAPEAAVAYGVERAQNYAGETEDEAAARAAAAGLGTIGGGMAGDALVGALRTIGAPAREKFRPDPKGAPHEQAAARLAQGLDPKLGESELGRINPTPGMVNPTVGRLENAGRFLPFTGEPIAEAQRKAYEQFQQATFRKAVRTAGLEGLDEVPAGAPGIKQIQSAFNHAYEGVFGGGPVQLDQGALRKGLGEVRLKYWPMLDDAEGKALLKRLDYISEQSKRGVMQGEVLSRLDDQLRDLGYKGDQVTGKVYRELRAALRNSLPEDLNTRITNLDKGYRNFSTLRRAAEYTKAREQGGVATPRHLQGAAAATDHDELSDIASDAIAAGMGGNYPAARGVAEAAGTIATLGGLGSLWATSEEPQLPLYATAALPLASLKYRPAGLGRRAAGKVLGGPERRRAFRAATTIAGREATEDDDER